MHSVTHAAIVLVDPLPSLSQNPSFPGRFAMRGTSKAVGSTRYVRFR